VSIAKTAARTPVSFAVPFLPRGKQSTEFNRTKNAKGRYAHAVPRVKRNARSIAAFVPYLDAPFEGAVRVDLTCVYYRVGMDLAWKVTAPDVEQLAKQVIDVLAACQYFAGSDAQVALLTVRKVLSAPPDSVFEAETTKKPLEEGYVMVVVSDLTGNSQWEQAT
jgi:Holliday junction resolvase RusA-like endonuclease